MTQRVAPLNIVHNGPGANRIISVSVNNGQTFDSALRETRSGDTLKWASMVEEDVVSHTFEVYTRQEIDDKHTEDAKAITQLQDTVHMLQQNLKDLADANDALTKRLDEIEKQLADKR